MSSDLPSNEPELSPSGAPGQRQKVLSLDALVPVLDCRRLAGRTIGFTNGTFDLLHVGHVRSLRWARSRADVLVVGVNSDRSVRSYKAAGRPIVPDRERAEIVAALECVDFVVVFDEPTAESLVAAIRPDVYVKGGDYSLDTLPEASVVRAWGGRIELVPLQEGRSTTGLIREIVERFGHT